MQQIWLNLVRNCKQYAQACTQKELKSGSLKTACSNIYLGNSNSVCILNVLSIEWFLAVLSSLSLFRYILVPYVNLWLWKQQKPLPGGVLWKICFKEVCKIRRNALSLEYLFCKVAGFKRAIFFRNGCGKRVFQWILKNI